MPIYLQIGPPKRDPIKSNSPGLKGKFYISLDEANAIKGMVREAFHLGWLPVDSCSFGTPRESLDNITQVVCTRYVDATSGQIFRLAQTGSELAANVDFVKAGGEPDPLPKPWTARRRSGARGPRRNCRRALSVHAGDSGDG